jgi:hypothetical protein
MFFKRMDPEYFQNQNQIQNEIDPSQGCLIFDGKAKAKTEVNKRLLILELKVV